MVSPIAMANSIRLNTKDISIVNLELCYLFALSRFLQKSLWGAAGLWPRRCFPPSQLQLVVFVFMLTQLVLDHTVCVTFVNWTEMYVLLYQVSSSCCFVLVSGCCRCNLNILCVYRPKFNSTWKVCTCLVCTCLVCTCFVMHSLVSSQLQLLFCLRGGDF